jgi:FAD/FMN-containing dehydrogenase
MNRITGIIALECDANRTGSANTKGACELDSKKEKLIEIVGEKNVSDNPEILEAHSSDHSFAQPLNPQFLVRVKNVDQVEEIVKWANQTRTPLVPVSSGPPHFNGDTVPGAQSAIIVDLSGMNKILRIDRRNRVTLIEPGVTYAQLQPELAKEGLTVCSPLLPRANKSVIASLLERQPTLIPKYHWSLPEPLRCLEVVWGNGEIFWTGEAGGQVHSLEKQWQSGLAQLDPKGPLETDWHRLVSASQGTMGIVTWATIKCQILPKVHKLFFVPAQNLDDLIDCAYKLLRLRLGDEFLLLNNANLAYLLRGEGNKIRALREELPPWVIIIGIAGRDILPEERVEVQEKDIRDIVQGFGLHLVPAIPGARNGQVLDALLQRSREPYWKLNYKGGCQDIFFLTTLNKTPEFVRTIYSLAEAIKYSSSDIGIYIQPQHQGVAYHCEFDLPFDPGDEMEVAKVKEFFTKASEELIKQGAYFSRPYGMWANMVYNRNAQSTILLKEIKEIFDPNHVLNPGKLCF